MKKLFSIAAILVFAATGFGQKAIETKQNFIQANFAKMPLKSGFAATVWLEGDQVAVKGDDDKPFKLADEGQFFDCFGRLGWEMVCEIDAPNGGISSYVFRRKK